MCKPPFSSTLIFFLTVILFLTIVPDRCIGKSYSFIKPFLGVAFEWDRQNEGILIKSIINNSNVFKSGLRSGDLIVELGQKTTRSITDKLDFICIINSLNYGEQAKIVFKRNSKVKYRDFVVEGKLFTSEYNDKITKMEIKYDTVRNNLLDFSDYPTTKGLAKCYVIQDNFRKLAAHVELHKERPLHASDHVLEVLYRLFDESKLDKQKKDEYVLSNQLIYDYIVNLASVIDSFIKEKPNESREPVSALIVFLERIFIDYYHPNYKGMKNYAETKNSLKFLKESVNNRQKENF